MDRSESEPHSDHDTLNSNDDNGINDQEEYEEESETTTVTEDITDPEHYQQRWEQKFDLMKPDERPKFGPERPPGFRMPRLKGVRGLPKVMNPQPPPVPKRGRGRPVNPLIVGKAREKLEKQKAINRASLERKKKMNQF
jgi:hypothetical protein